MRVNTRYMNLSKYKVHKLHQRYTHWEDVPLVDVPLVEFMYLVFSQVFVVVLGLCISRTPLFDDSLCV